MSKVACSRANQIEFQSSKSQKSSKEYGLSVKRLIKTESQSLSKFQPEFTTTVGSNTLKTENALYIAIVYKKIQLLLLIYDK